MLNLNKAIIAGSVVKEPKIKDTGGKLSAAFPVATTESYKDKSGKWQEKTEWHQVVVFNDTLAKMVELKVHAGTNVYIEGEIKTNKYTGQDGIEKEYRQIVVNYGTVKVINKQEREAQSQPTGSTNKSTEQLGTVRADDDGVPF